MRAVIKRERFVPRRTHFLAGAFVLFVGGMAAHIAGVSRGGASFPGGSPSSHATSAALSAADLDRGYNRLRDDLYAEWFTATGVPATGDRPGIRGTQGNGLAGNGTLQGVTSYQLSTFWQEAQFAKWMAADFYLRGRDHAVRRRLAEDLALLRATYTVNDATHGLGSDGRGDGSIAVSDDAAWKVAMLQELGEITGDPALVATIRSAIIAINGRFKDGFTPHNQVVVGPLIYSQYGMAYQDNVSCCNAGRSTTYEVGTLLASLFVYQHTGERAFLKYPEAVYASFRAKLQHSSGVYYEDLQIDSSRAYDPTPYLVPIRKNVSALPAQGLTGFTIGGTTAMAVLAARLYRITKDDRYRRDVSAIVAGIAADYIENGMIMEDRDPWTAGFFFFDFAREVLVLPGADPTGTVRAAIIATGHHIITTRVAIDADLDGAIDGFGYKADWSASKTPLIGLSGGPYASWEASGLAANGGAGGGQALPWQIMTNAQDAIVVAAADLLSR